MCNVVQLCLAANNILLICKQNHAFSFLPLLLHEKWQIASLPEDMQINYLPQPSAFWQIIDLLATDK